jgi:hypothetical protein
MLHDLSPDEIDRTARRRVGSAPMPYLHDPAVRDRALAIAESQGLLERFEQALAADEPIAALRRSDFREFQRTGARGRHEAARKQRQRRVEMAAVACWLGRDHLDQLQDLLWAECENTWWVFPAHEDGCPLLDLSSAMLACRYAMLVSLLGERLEAEVRDRLAGEVRRRVLDPFRDPARPDPWWRRTGNNWNAVCHAGIAIAAMLLERDADRLSEVLVKALGGLGRFIDGFADDGGCSEGPGYWRYGFGWYCKLGEALHAFSGGRIDIMAGEKIVRICRYPLSVTIAPGRELTFADAHGGRQAVPTCARINRFHDVPELFGLCRLRDDGSIQVDSLEDLLLYDGRRVAPPRLTRDAFLPDLGVALLRGGDTAVGAKAGHNDEHHNHNDVGSFIVHRAGTDYLCDPGGPRYTADTFGDRRYESVFTNSFGHSVPVIDGRLQSPGRRFAGEMAAEGLNAGDVRRVTIEMAGAYDAPALKRLTRVIELPADGGEVRLADAFAFAGGGVPVEEAFISTCPCRVMADGRRVAIRADGGGEAVLSAADDTEGAFRVDELHAESKDSPHGRLLRRIVFTPAAAPEMPLRFALRCK